MAHHIAIRTFLYPAEISEQHSFVIGAVATGASDILEHILIEKNRTTIKELRKRVEVKHDGYMSRRTILFQDFLIAAQSCKNPFNQSRTQYRFAYLEDETDSIPTLIDDESTFVSKYMPEVFLIPVSQICQKCGKICLGQCDGPLPKKEIDVY
eukprot:TRINITY_DN778096_c0_g1_i1.p1 TRINITY_DN778096_c0_g1~~TRINITY_DN778096_c0_g1_i1.p1  ORF type:complete len:153 (-),score=18.53 TRINITY_DN778096_c0_g1_i1:229-687(-)